MSVSLLSSTVPVIKDVEIKDLFEYIAYCARISNPGNQKLNKNGLGLIKYLTKHGHWSPFEMANICLDIQTTRDISRQILRHRSFSFQEFSQRYACVNEPFVIREPRLQDTKNRQNSLKSENESLNKEWIERQEHLNNLIRENYIWALDNGIAKEQARAILPEGNTPTRLYMNGSLRSWIHYLKLRLDPSTQKEHREIAYLCMLAIKDVFPYIEEATMKIDNINDKKDSCVESKDSLNTFDDFTKHIDKLNYLESIQTLKEDERNLEIAQYTDQFITHLANLNESQSKLWMINLNQWDPVSKIQASIKDKLIYVLEFREKDNFNSFKY